MDVSEWCRRWPEFAVDGNSIQYFILVSSGVITHICNKSPDEAVEVVASPAERRVGKFNPA